LSGRGALQAAADLFCRQLQISIREGANSNALMSILSALSHIDPLEVANSGEYGFLWLADILNSGYPDNDRHAMANRIIQLLGKRVYPTNPHQWDFPSSWIPPLLDFLSLCEKLRSADGFTALRILSSGRRYPAFGARILPVLTSILLPTNPLRSRMLALKIFHRFAAGWCPSQMEKLLRKDLNNFLQAVGDPFQFPDPSLQGERSVETADYNPMEAAVILIEFKFASSGSWRNHLRRSNFGSCEEALSTEKGKRTALSCMFATATNSWPKFLCTPAKVIAAVKRLEELQCLNTAETVLLWAWTANIMDVGDHGALELIERGTLDFYRTHGTWRLSALSRHVTNNTTETLHVNFLLTHYGGEPCRVGSVRQPLSIEEAMKTQRRQHFEDLRVAQVCQLRRLYLLFGYDPVTWKDAVAVGELDRGTDWSSVRLVTPPQFTDWTCDYP